MYAVIETGGKQYRVTQGDTIDVEKLPGEVGSEIEFAKVLAIFKEPDKLLSGSDLGKAKVKATITGHGRREKILVFKFKRKKQYKRTTGHRQAYTRLKVDESLAEGERVGAQKRTRQLKKRA
jgi:large subunit ribosomal protein L21